MLSVETAHCDGENGSLGAQVASPDRVLAIVVLCSASCAWAVPWTTTWPTCWSPSCCILTR